jgi:hypothetical protein
VIGRRRKTLSQVGRDVRHESDWEYVREAKDKTFIPESDTQIFPLGMSPLYEEG